MSPAFLSDGRIAGAVLAIMVLEALVLLAYRRITGRGLYPLAVILMLLPGACLVLALRAALAEGPSGTMLAWLAAAFAAHLADLVHRTRKKI